MVAPARRMSFEEFARELPRVFDSIARSRQIVLVEREGRLYRLEQESAPSPDEVWASYDPERVLQALAQSAGSLVGVDVDELLADLRDARAQRSRDTSAQ